LRRAGGSAGEVGEAGEGWPSYLREAGALDPLPGNPLKHQANGELVDINPGRWRDHQANGVQISFADFKTGLPPACPVTPIAKDGARFRFLDTTNQEVVLDAQRGGKMVIEALFSGRHHYLWWAWPRWSKPVKKRGATQPEPSRVIGFDGEAAWADLMQACALLDGDEVEVRGRGAWRGRSGELVYHAGDALLVKGEWRPCGQRDGCIYPWRPRIGKPALRFAPEGRGSPGEQLLEVLLTFNWDRRELDARLVLGWLMTAKIGGALRRRPVLFVHGGEGSGKSTLQELMRLAMNGAMVATADATMAGIAQYIGQDSIAILVDELEAREDPRKNEGVLALARIGYSGDEMRRGGKDGAGKSFTLRSSFMASAVNKPATEAQDDSRMALLMLRERQAAGEKLEINPRWAGEIGRDLLKRLIDWWPNWDELERRFRATLVEGGHNDRSADTFAPLAAGCHVALRDDMPEAGELKDWQGWLDPKELHEIADRERGWYRCLTQLLSAPVEAWRHDNARSVGAMLLGFKKSPEHFETCSKFLPQVGLQLMWDRGEAQTFEKAQLFVSSNHAQLRQLFEGTPWAGRAGQPGPWAWALRQAPPALWTNAKCGRGFLQKASGIAIRIAKALPDVGADEEE